MVSKHTSAAPRRESICVTWTTWQHERLCCCYSSLCMAVWLFQVIPNLQNRRFPTSRSPKILPFRPYLGPLIWLPLAFARSCTSTWSVASAWRRTQWKTCGGTPGVVPWPGIRTSMMGIGWIIGIGVEGWIGAKGISMISKDGPGYSTITITYYNKKLADSV